MQFDQEAIAPMSYMVDGLLLCNSWAAAAGLHTAASAQVGSKQVQGSDAHVQKHHGSLNGTWQVFHFWCPRFSRWQWEKLALPTLLCRTSLAANPLTPILGEARASVTKNAI